jgi:RNA polymerase sigma-70 factor (ECF subfamily)
VTGVVTDRGQLEPELEKYRVELTGYCYRMLGSAFEAEDAVQDTMVRAWRSLDRFEGRSQLRSWLYKIATNVCYDMLNGKQRRARPVDLGPASAGNATLPEPTAEAAWLSPVPDGRVLPTDGDPAELAVGKESIRLAFVAALAHLPPKQRAVLILREVLRWKAEEVAELLETSVASVNSALQRARATLSATEVSDLDAGAPVDPDDEDLVRKYADAFERYDMDELVTLLSDDARFSMPPFSLWFQGGDDIATFMLTTGAACRGSKLLPTIANGLPAFGHYKPAADGQGFDPWSLLVLELSEGKVAGITHFLDTPRIFPLFGFPDHLEA